FTGEREPRTPTLLVHTARTFERAHTIDRREGHSAGSVSSSFRASFAATTSGWDCTPRFPARSHAIFSAGIEVAWAMSSSAASISVVRSGAVGNGWITYS